MVSEASYTILAVPSPDCPVVLGIVDRYKTTSDLLKTLNRNVLSCIRCPIISAFSYFHFIMEILTSGTLTSLV